MNVPTQSKRWVDMLDSSSDDDEFVVPPVVATEERKEPVLQHRNAKELGLTGGDDGCLSLHSSWGTCINNALVQKVQPTFEAPFICQPSFQLQLPSKMHAVLSHGVHGSYDSSGCGGEHTCCCSTPATKVPRVVLPQLVSQRRDMVIVATTAPHVTLRCYAACRRCVHSAEHLLHSAWNTVCATVSAASVAIAHQNNNGGGAAASTRHSKASKPRVVIVAEDDADVTTIVHHCITMGALHGVNAASVDATIEANEGTHIVVGSVESLLQAVKDGHLDLSALCMTVVANAALMFQDQGARTASTDSSGTAIALVAGLWNLLSDCGRPNDSQLVVCTTHVTHTLARFVLRKMQCPMGVAVSFDCEGRGSTFAAALQHRGTSSRVSGHPRGCPSMCRSTVQCHPLTWMPCTGWSVKGKGSGGSSSTTTTGYGCPCSRPPTQQVLPLCAVTRGWIRGEVEAGVRIRHVYVNVEREEWKRSTLLDILQHMPRNGHGTLRNVVIYASGARVAQDTAVWLAHALRDDKAGWKVMTAHSGDSESDVCDAAVALQSHNADTPVVVVTTIRDPLVVPQRRGDVRVLLQVPQRWEDYMRCSWPSVGGCSNEQDAHGDDVAGGQQVVLSLMSREEVERVDDILHAVGVGLAHDAEHRMHMLDADLHELCMC